MGFLLVLDMALNLNFTAGYQFCEFLGWNMPSTGKRSSTRQHQCVYFSGVKSNVFIFRDYYPLSFADFGYPYRIICVAGEMVIVGFHFEAILPQASHHLPAKTAVDEISVLRLLLRR